MKALLYTRPRIDSFYHRLATEWLGEDGYTSMSDHTGLEPIDIMRYFYQAQREQTVRFSNIPLNSVDYHMIATRCRYLRLVSFNSAVRHINAMWLAFERIFERVQPDVILGPVMDSYVLDVADRVARREHQHRHRMAGQAQAAQHLEPVDAGQPDVEHHQVEGRLGDAGEGRLAGLEVVDQVSLEPERARKAGREAAVVFHNKQAGGILAFSLHACARPGGAEPRSQDLRPARGCRWWQGTSVALP